MEHESFGYMQPTENTKPEDPRARVVEENKVVWELYKADIVPEMCFRGDGRGAIFVLESASIDMVKEAFLQLPMVRDGILIANLFHSTLSLNLSMHL